MARDRYPAGDLATPTADHRPVYAEPVIGAARELWSWASQLATLTVRAWWALLPQLLTLHLLGWLVLEVTFRVCSLVIDHSGWLTLLLFAAGLLLVLTTVVLQLRLVTNLTGGRRLVPREIRDDAAAGQHDITRFLGLTILPFLCIYAVFGEISTFLQRLTHESIAIQGVWDGTSLLQQFNLTPWWPRGVLIIGALVVITVLRRVLESASGRTGRRGYGMFAAFCECLVMLTLLLIGAQLVAQIEIAWGGWRISAWLETAAGWSGGLGIHLGTVGALLNSAWKLVWPVFSEVVVLTVVWFALAGLVHGSKVVSLADLWQAGVSPRQALQVLRRRSRPTVAGSRSLRQVVLTGQEILFGDLDDKYLPAWQSGRLALRAGISFLVALCVLHTLLRQAGVWLDALVVQHIVGGQLYDFWFRFLPMLQLPVDLLIEPLRITLLAVAVTECYRRLQARAQPAAGAGAVGSTDLAVATDLANPGQPPRVVR